MHIMKVYQFSWDTDYRFTGDKYNEDKPLFLGHRLSFLLGTTLKTIFPGDIALSHQGSNPAKFQP